MIGIAAGSKTGGDELLSRSIDFDDVDRSAAVKGDPLTIA
jgi:hypothetical protein